jgi:hypothetical protein
MKRRRLPGWWDEGEKRGRREMGEGWRLEEEKEEEGWDERLRESEWWKKGV